MITPEVIVITALVFVWFVARGFIHSRKKREENNHGH